VPTANLISGQTENSVDIQIMRLSHLRNKTSVMYIVLGLLLVLIVSMKEVNAITQFYFAIPEVIEDTEGIIFSVDANNEVFSWIVNGTSIIPANNNTSNTQSNDTDMDLDANEYLLAIDNNLDIGTRVYMCVHLPYYFIEPTCETDAIDTDRLARASFQFLFK